MRFRFLLCTGFFTFLASNTCAVTVTVDFTKMTHPVSPRAFCADVGEYVGNGGSPDLNNDFPYLASLGLDCMRIDIQNGNGTAPALGAGGTNGSADSWVKAIDKAGAKPVIRVHTGNENDNGANSGGSAADAAALVTHYTVNYKALGLSRPVTHFTIGNESNADDTTDQGGYLISYAPAMRAAAGDIKLFIGGPAVAFYNRSGLDAYMKNTKAHNVIPDEIVFHQYGTGPNDGTTTQQALNGGGNGGDVQQNGTVSYKAEIMQLKGDIESIFGAPKESVFNTDATYQYPFYVSVGEWGDVNTGANDPNMNVAWHASVVGNIIKEFGGSSEYSDSNLINGSNLEVPYYATLMFTGGQHNPDITDLKFKPLFPHFGTDMAEESAEGDTTKNIQGQNITVNTTVEVYASANPTNMVVINKTDAALSVTFQLTGAPASADQWETTGGMPAKVKAGIDVGTGTFTAELKPYAVDTFVLPAATN